MPEVEEQLEVPQEPVEGAAPAAEQGEIASESAPDETAPKPEAEKQDGALQKRIDKLNRKATLAEERAEYWRQQALQQQQQPKPETTKPSVPDDEPKEEDFETAKDYVKALSRWQYRQLSAEEKAAIERESKQQQEQTSQQQLQNKVATELAAAKAQFPDFNEVMEDSVVTGENPVARQLIAESENSGVLFYHLVKSGQLQGIWDIKDPAKIARELGKIEARIASAPVATPPAPSTSTPPPLKPVPASRQTVAPTQADDDTEWLRQRRAELAKKR